MKKWTTRKHGWILFLGILVTFSIAGCGAKETSSSKVSNGNAVEQVLQEQTAKSEEKVESTEQESREKTAGKASASSADVDYDLTAMSSDMVYATVYQLMTEPDSYIGKTFRMEGAYYASYYESTDTYYHFCVIQDATACCSQGLEFIWGDGTHVYPDEYPKEGDTVTVEGTFATYREEGDENLYCRLENAVLDR